MSVNILTDMLLIKDPSVFKLYEELMRIAGYFIAPVFTIALVLEYLGEMNFIAVIKKTRYSGGIYGNILLSSY